MIAYIVFPFDRDEHVEEILMTYLSMKSKNHSSKFPVFFSFPIRT